MLARTSSSLSVTRSDPRRSVNFLAALAVAALDAPKVRLVLLFGEVLGARARSRP